MEIDLLLDEVIYGNSFYKIVDGKKVRIDPRDVYIQPRQPRWWVRLWYWIKRQFKRGDEWVGCYHD